MRRVVSDLLDREDDEMSRAFSRLSRHEREAYRYLQAEINKRFKPDKKADKPMLSDIQILVIQVAGFVAALAFLPFMHGLVQVLFSSAFAVHFIGDMFRLRKDKVI